MALTINTNIASLSAQRALTQTQNRLAANMGRLSSGQRINSAADDAAGLGISERLKAQIGSFGAAARNANDGVSMIQVAEGAMNEQAGLLVRLRELAVQAANGTLGTTEQGYLDAEAQSALSEIDRISDQTEFNGIHMIGANAGALSMQVGVQSGETIGVTFHDTDSAGLSLTGLKLDTAANASTALGTIDAAITTLSGFRADAGAAQNRLTVSVSNIATIREGLSAANSRIRDVDVAEETAAMTRNQILAQAGVAVLAQANQLPSMALRLLQ